MSDIAWYSDNSEDRIHEAGLKKPNKLGLYDMLGNSWEWCWDLYDEKTYGPYRIFRGGVLKKKPEKRAFYDIYSIIEGPLLYTSRVLIRKSKHQPNFHPIDVFRIRIVFFC